MKRVIALTLFVLVFAGCNGAPVCKVNGEIKGFKGESEVYIKKQISEHERDTLISAVMTDGKFSMTVPDSLLGFVYEIGFKDVRGSIQFFAEDGEVTVSGDKDSLFYTRVSGTYENDRMKSNKDCVMRLSQLREEKMVAAGQGNARAVMAEIDGEINRFRDSMIHSDSNSVFSLYLEKQRLPLFKHTQIDEKLVFFSDKLKTHEYYVEMAQRADILRKIAVGAVAPDFTAMTPDGKEISLSSFKGKYVLLDFWASWCAPCRAENKHSKQLHQDFAKKGLNILSFSLDSDKDKWIQAIKADGLVWDNASDLVGGVLSPIAQLYGIDGIPALWLIGPDGVIIAENVRGEKLHKLCEEIFNK